MYFDLLFSLPTSLYWIKIIILLKIKPSSSLFVISNHAITIVFNDISYNILLVFQCFFKLSLNLIHTLAFCWILEEKIEKFVPILADKNSTCPTKINPGEEYFLKNKFSKNLLITYILPWNPWTHQFWSTNKNSH